MPPPERAQNGLELPAAAGHQGPGPGPGPLGEQGRASSWPGSRLPRLRVRHRRHRQLEPWIFCHRGSLMSQRPAGAAVIPF